MKPREEIRIDSTRRSTLTISVSRSLLRQLTERAKAEGRPPSRVAHDLITDGLASNVHIDITVNAPDPLDVSRLLALLPSRHKGCPK